MAGSMRHDGSAMREKAVSLAMKRKEEYLGARVPKELRDQVTAKAKDLGIPVSILIRNILEESFNGAGVSPEITSPPSFSESANTDVKEDVLNSVLGWKRITLNKEAVCACCGVTLEPGREVAFGLGGVKPIVLCDPCKDRM